MKSNITIEHYIEVEYDPDQAFTWGNLYLSCTDCNRRKLPHTSLPVSDCLNPCDPSENPVDHLTFDDEQIRSQQNSPRGQKTIQKYRLGRPELDFLRVKQL